MALPPKTRPTGDVYGQPWDNHRVEVVHAAVLILEDGTEGLLSAYRFDEDNNPIARMVFVTSNGGNELEVMKRGLRDYVVPDGARIEWREYVRKP